MTMSTQVEITQAAKKNYSQSSPWPENDTWHQYTFTKEKETIEHWLSTFTTENLHILNAGSGGTCYKTKGKLIHLDIIEDYIRQYDGYIVGSVEKIDLPDLSVDGVICVGSVLNYADAQQSISEFTRILKYGGFLILEFERSNSAEFLGTEYHGKYIFSKTYCYNEQSHPLWLYSEKHIRTIMKHYGYSVKKCERIHIISSLLNRFGVHEENAAKFAKFDHLFKFLSYPLAHNTILFCVKDMISK